MIRRIKLFYVLYNFFHRKKLVHNLKFYKLLKLNKNYFSSVSSSDFKKIDPNFFKKQSLTIDLQETEIFKQGNSNTQKSILDFNKNGFLILEKYISHDVVNQINSEIEDGVNKQELKFTYGSKIMFAIHKIDVLNQIGINKNLNDFLSSLIGGKVKLFQSINFINGSQQKTHSDSIHMTTFPLGGLLGVWVALEDISLDNGPLHYYPGSQKLPYYLNSDYKNEGNAFLIGDKDYTEYEQMIAQKLVENKLEKEVFLAKKGDILVWHANLFHGGEPHINKSKTRKSVVFHYYLEECIRYHEITQRPALLE